MLGWGGGKFKAHRTVGEDHRSDLGSARLGSCYSEGGGGGGTGRVPPESGYHPPFGKQRKSGGGTSEGDRGKKWG